ncbi:hypothetical protein SAMN06264364_1242 [Quadrisphaera granulorum]|uniref:Uncharacterized protein n=1 Tax=Quadrisphaera granulorum TaxID=317664 RepID=A0A315ZW28_9ACTN|nr:hypothetical protein [Quadrisphaera granulorum]PWJ49836.1 hypothetical protein BXY45_1242 [Quadrisphaera granulorum]SZE98044.1 hypothetical protein SAMN06264364_1242 [Quadrisphaera granulorum]
MGGESAVDAPLDATVLRHLAGRATSNRRTAQGRRALASDPTTRRIVEGALQLLAAEVGAPLAVTDRATAQGGNRCRMLDQLSAQAVADAATRLGPLRATPAHVRDRWPRQGDLAQDLVAHLLVRSLWGGHLERTQRQALADAAADASRPLGEQWVELGLHLPRDPLLHRLHVVAVVLASGDPRLQAVAREGRAAADDAWSSVLSCALRARGLRPRAGVHLADLARGLSALLDGVHLVALEGGDDPAVARRCAHRLQRGLDVLAHAALEPGEPPRGPAPADGPASTAAPPAAPQVLARLTDPVTGTRRTERGRRVLAEDALTEQLLAGATAVLAEDLTGATSPRLFEALSFPQVAAATTADGRGSVTAAQVKDRWPRHEGLVEDVLSYSVSAHGGMYDAGFTLGAQVTEGAPGDFSAFAHAVTAAELAWVLDRPSAKARLLGSVLTQGRPRLHAALVAARTAQRDVWGDLNRAVLSTFGLSLRAPITPEDQAELLVAISEGVVLRILATGEQGWFDRRTGESLLGRLAPWAFLGCVDDTAGAGSGRVTAKPR